MTLVGELHYKVEGRVLLENNGRRTTSYLLEDTANLTNLGSSSSVGAHQWMQITYEPSNTTAPNTYGRLLDGLV